MHASTLVDALKRLLKAHDVTYARVAAGLGLSEASVKRMFSRRDFTLQRLEAATREPHQTADQPHLFVAARRSDPAAFPGQVEAEYLSSKFNRRGELFVFVNGMLSRQSLAVLKSRMRKVAADFAELHRDDLALPLHDRQGTSALLAIRPWEPQAFRALRRKHRAPVPAGRLLHSASVADAVPRSSKRRS